MGVGQAEQDDAGVISILFWNLDENPATLSHLECMGRKHSVDVFLLAECPSNLNPAIAALNSLNLGVFREAGKIQPKVRVLTRLGTTDFDHVLTTIGGETAVWTIRAPKLQPPEVLLAVTHLPAKSGGNTAASQAAVAEFAAAELAQFEDARTHRNSVFIGDFNMNPFDPGMTLVTGLHALMTVDLARKRDRKFRNRRFRRFYNPMWGLFGDRTAGPSGSYYWRSSVPENSFWSMHDQVLLRPVMIDRLHVLEILSNDGTHNLVPPNGEPRKGFLSDHLPLRVVLDI